MKPRYFRSQAEFRAWLETRHARETELLVGFYKKGAAKHGISYAEALDEALCFGWIDGVRKGVDDSRWTIRFTPRKAKSRWSAVNVKRMHELIALGRVRHAGLAAFERRDVNKPGYSYEEAERKLSPAYRRKLEDNARAAAWFDEQPPSYRRVCSFWVMSAKKEETRLSRLARLIACSAKGTKL